jgi:phage tail tube protein FII
MKKTVFIFISIALILFASCDTKQTVLMVENVSGFDRKSQTVEIPLQNVEQKFGKVDYCKLKLTDSKGISVAYQITYDSKFIFQLDIKAGETLSFVLKQGKDVQVFEPKTYARFIRERKDDFAWENDKVAFRIYGPALKPIDGPSNGIDVWYKRTDKLIIDKWYETDLAGKGSYHEDHGEGLDDYKVGRSLGAGGMAPFVNDSLWLNENFVTQELLDNGPVRSTLKLTYGKLEVNGKEYLETRTISIDAGSQLTKITQSYEGVSGNITVAAGIAKRNGNDSIVAKDNYVIYVEPYSDKVGQVFLAMVFPDGYKTTTVNMYKVGNSSYSHVLAVCDYKGPVTYYSGYGWSKAGFFSDISVFEKYVFEFSESAKSPLKVTYRD